MSAAPGSAPWAATYTGGSISILNPSVESIRLEDIAGSLSAINRFGGHTKFTWSVASHSLLCESLCTVEIGAEGRLAVLLHDAHEMVTGDLTTPFKDALADLAGKDVVGMLQKRIDQVIHIAAGLGHVPRYRDLIRVVDLQALAIEKRDLLVPGRNWDLVLPNVDDAPRLRAETRVGARARFIRRFHTLRAAAGLTCAPTFYERMGGA